MKINHSANFNPDFSRSKSLIKSGPSFFSKSTVRNNLVFHKKPNLLFENIQRTMENLKKYRTSSRLYRERPLPAYSSTFRKTIEEPPLSSQIQKLIHKLKQSNDIQVLLDTLVFCYDHSSNKNMIELFKSFIDNIKKLFYVPLSSFSEILQAEDKVIPLTTAVRLLNDKCKFLNQQVNELQASLKDFTEHRSRKYESTLQTLLQNQEKDPCHVFEIASKVIENFNSEKHTLKLQIISQQDCIKNWEEMYSQIKHKLLKTTETLSKIEEEKRNLKKSNRTLLIEKNEIQTELEKTKISVNDLHSSNAVLLSQAKEMKDELNDLQNE